MMLHCNCLVKNNSSILFVPTKWWQRNSLKVWILPDSLLKLPVDWTYFWDANNKWALFVQIFKPLLESHWRHKTEVCLDVTHCLGDPQDLSPLSTCLMYARNIAQLNPIIGRYTGSSIPALKITSADGWNGETAYHFGFGPRHCKTILSTLIFRMT